MPDLKALQAQFVEARDAYELGETAEQRMEALARINTICQQIEDIEAARTLDEWTAANLIKGHDHA